MLWMQNTWHCCCWCCDGCLFKLNLLACPLHTYLIHIHTYVPSSFVRLIGTSAVNALYERVSVCRITDTTTKHRIQNKKHPRDTSHCLSKWKRAREGATHTHTSRMTLIKGIPSMTMPHSRSKSKTETCKKQQQEKTRHRNGTERTNWIIENDRNNNHQSSSSNSNRPKDEKRVSVVEIKWDSCTAVLSLSHSLCVFVYIIYGVRVCTSHGIRELIS